MYSSVHWIGYFLQGTKKHGHVFLVTLYNTVKKKWHPHFKSFIFKRIFIESNVYCVVFPILYIFFSIFIIFIDNSRFQHFACFMKILASHMYRLWVSIRCTRS